MEISEPHKPAAAGEGAPEAGGEHEKLEDMVSLRENATNSIHTNLTHFLVSHFLSDSRIGWHIDHNQTRTGIYEHPRSIASWN